MPFVILSVMPVEKESLTQQNHYSHPFCLIIYGHNGPFLFFGPGDMALVFVFSQIMCATVHKRTLVITSLNVTAHIRALQTRCLKWHYMTKRHIIWKGKNQDRLASVADPDPGSGAFLTPGSGIGNRFFPDPGSRIPDPTPIFSRAQWQFFG